MRYKTKVSKLIHQSRNNLDNLERQVRAMRGLNSEAREELLGFIESTQGQLKNAEQLVELENEDHSL